MEILIFQYIDRALSLLDIQAYNKISICRNNDITNYQIKRIRNPALHRLNIFTITPTK